MGKNINKVALTAGIIWSLTLFLMTLLSVYTGYAKEFLMAMGSVYPGYDISLTGSFVGLVYGFLDAFIGLYIIMWVYEKVKGWK